MNNTNNKNNTGDYNTGDYNTGDGNTGNCNTGYFNTGNYNAGYFNTGHCNTGDYNTGHFNTGHCNTGDYNTGYFNTGDCNTGDYNTGYFNTGDCNTGDFNAGCYNTGCFNTESPTLFFFDSPSEWKYEDWAESGAKGIMDSMPVPGLVFVYTKDMTDEEKAAHPEHETTGGYLAWREPQETKQEWWDSLSEDDKNEVKALPNFDAEKFQKITGICV